MDTVLRARSFGKPIERGVGAAVRSSASSKGVLMELYICPLTFVCQMERMRTVIYLLCTISVQVSLTSAVDNLRLELASVVSVCGWWGILSWDGWMCIT